MGIMPKNKREYADEMLDSLFEFIKELEASENIPNISKFYQIEGFVDAFNKRLNEYPF